MVLVEECRLEYLPHESPSCAVFEENNFEFDEAAIVALYNSALSDFLISDPIVSQVPFVEIPMPVRRLIDKDWRVPN